MGVDYNASLAYGYEAPEIDRDKHEDGWWEPSAMWAAAIAPDAVNWEQRNAALTARPCPIGSITFGDSYGGDTSWVIGPNDGLFSVDLYGLGTKIDVPTGDPEAARAAVQEFCEVVGLPMPEGEPSWKFGGYVH